MPTSQTIVSTDGNHKAVIEAFADNYFFFRQIGAWIHTYRKVKSRFLFFTWDEWVGEIAPASISITYSSAPDPFNGSTVTRFVTVRSSRGGYTTGHCLWSVGFSISMDANGSATGLPDAATTSIGPSAPPLPVQSLKAFATATFPTGQSVNLTAENRF